MSATPLAVALMAMGRDARFLVGALPQLRAALDPRARLAVLVDEATPGEFDALAPHADTLVVSRARSGFAVARRRALFTALSFEPDAVLVSDGDGLFPAASIAAFSRAVLAAPDAVFLPQREGHTLPAGDSGVGPGSREALERVENAAGAWLIRRPDLATRDLQPGALAMPADVAREVLEQVSSRDFAWELECALALLRLRTRRALFPALRASPQEQTSFAPADARAKLAMLARHFGEGALRAALGEVRSDRARLGVPEALLDALDRA